MQAMNENPQAPPRRRHEWIAWLALFAVLAAVIAILVWGGNETSGAGSDVGPGPGDPGLNPCLVESGGARESATEADLAAYYRFTGAALADAGNSDGEKYADPSTDGWKELAQLQAEIMKGQPFDPQQGFSAKTAWCNGTDVMADGTEVLRVGWVNNGAPLRYAAHKAYWVLWEGADGTIVAILVDCHNLIIIPPPHGGGTTTTVVTSTTVPGSSTTVLICEPPMVLKAGKCELPPASPTIPPAPSVVVSSTSLQPSETAAPDPVPPGPINTVDPPVSTVPSNVGGGDTGVDIPPPSGPLPTPPSTSIPEGQVGSG